MNFVIICNKLCFAFFMSEIHSFSVTIKTQCLFHPILVRANSEFLSMCPLSAGSWDPQSVSEYLSIWISVGHIIPNTVGNGQRTYSIRMHISSFWEWVPIVNPSENSLEIETESYWDYNSITRVLRATCPDEPVYPLTAVSRIFELGGPNLFLVVLPM